MDIASVLHRLEAASGDADALALATVDIALESRDPELRGALDAAAIPHWFNESSLLELLGDRTPRSPGWFAQLTALTMIEPFHSHGGWNVHELTRLALRDRLASEQAELFRRLGARAAELAGGQDWSQTIERVYHLLSSSPDQGARQLRRLWKQWQRAGERHYLQALAKMLDELCERDRLAPLPKAYALIALGEVREDQILLADCEALARNALEITIELRDDIGFIDANALLGRVLRERGHLEAAIAAFDSAASRLEALVSSQSNLTDLDGQQASVHTDWGRALMDRGQYEEALAHFETSKAIHEERHRRATGEDKLIESQDLATAYVDLGDLLSWTSRSSDAEELYARALGLLEESRAAGRKSLQLKQNIARLRLRLHDVLTLRGEVDGAAQQLGAAEELSRELVREEPDHFGWKTDLADVQARRSQFSYERGRLEEVEGYLDAAVDTYSGLADRDPTRTIWREGLAVLRSALARLRERQERYVESAQEYAGSRDILEKLSAADPERVAWKLSIASTQQDIALLAARILGILPDDQRDLAFLESMILNAKRARDTVKEIAGRDVGNVRRRDDLANAEWVVARVLRTCADCIDAGMEIDLPEGMSAESLRNSSLQIYAASADNLKELLAQEPEQIYRRWALVDSVTGAAAVLEELGRHEDAIRLQRLALVPVEALVARDPENQTWNSKLASVREAISRLEKQMSSHPVLT